MNIAWKRLAHRPRKYTQTWKSSNTDLQTKVAWTKVYCSHLITKLIINFLLSTKKNWAPPSWIFFLEATRQKVFNDTWNIKFRSSVQTLMRFENFCRRLHQISLENIMSVCLFISVVLFIISGIQVHRKLRFVCFATFWFGRHFDLGRPPKG